jgi:hypothetical protein
MKPVDLKSDVLPAFLLGRARRKPTYARLGGSWPADGDGADLKAAALLSQALRLERPPAPATYAAPAAVAMGRARVPEEARAAFVRLFGAGKGGLPANDPLASAMASALDRLSLAPHPLDFHRLEPFLRTHADKLGGAVAAWLDRDAAALDDGDVLDGDGITDADWTLATPARRERYIRERRRSDPGTARALVEAAWASEKADLRLRLLRALGGRLGDDDRPFLESLATDRASTVRDLAAHLLARLDGRRDDGRALKAVLDRISRRTSGLLRRRTILTIEPPADVPAEEGFRWIRSAFAAIDLDALLKALDMDADQAIAAAADDDLLTAAFAVMALRSRRFDLLGRTAMLSTFPLMLLAEGVPDDADVAADEAPALAAAVFSTFPDLPPSAIASALRTYHQMTDAPLPPRIFEGLLARWTSLPAGDDVAVRSQLLTALAIVAPAAGRPDLRRLANDQPDIGGPVAAWLDLLHRLEEAVPR